MSSVTSFLSEDQFTCSICLDVFTNPVSTPCGHSFCQACITCYWDKAGSKACFCPICKESFRKRPELHINRTLRDITEQFKLLAEVRPRAETSKGVVGVGESSSEGREEGLHNAKPHQPHRKSRQMPGSVMAEMRLRLQHAQSSEEASHPSGRHSQSEPEDSSANVPLCPIHQRGLEYFCHNHQACVCSSCLETAEHQGHSAVPAKREWQIKKTQLEITEVELKELVKLREKKMEEIQRTLRDMKVCAERETSGSVQVFSQLVSYVERCQSEILEAIEMSCHSAEHRAQCLLHELGLEIAELKKRSAALSQLAQTDDYIHFLKTFPMLTSLPQTKNWSETHLNSEVRSGTSLQTITHMMERFREELRKLPELVFQTDSNIEVKRVQEYAENVTFDPNTAHPRLIISVDGKQVCCGDRHHPVLDTPERFDRVVCVLARQGFTSGRHYWEVKVGDKTDWDLGVASHSINRKGKITVSPAHGYWFLSLRDRKDYAFRAEPAIPLSLSLRPSRIGIFVDCDKGKLSFYDVEAKVLIYTFVDSFVGAIHPFFSPCTNKSGQNGTALIICPVATTV
ncbi:E3 ubiquitin-protein ligase TRIM7 [Merluccius polli]|uniref:E3 ubiquitin-protein ligase TRIM7 n=1 Tax=Merluccius polli TaxID=89951 RepID=A0AA47NXW3_MERPO|nr:E3 ubiquitin-protein ligase TRIM7 [Merluccius polli]